MTATATRLPSGMIWAMALSATTRAPRSHLLQMRVEPALPGHPQDALHVARRQEFATGEGEPAPEALVVRLAKVV